MSALLANLVDAVIEGRIADVRSFLQRTKGAGVNYCNQDGVSLLSRAISHGHTDIAMLLMSFSNLIHVNARDRDGFTALHRACWLLPPLATMAVDSVPPGDTQQHDPVFGNEPLSARSAASHESNEIPVPEGDTPPPPKRKSVVVQSPQGQRGGSREGPRKVEIATRPPYSPPEPKVIPVPPVPLHRAPSLPSRSARSSARESARSFPPQRPFGNSHTVTDVIQRLLDLGGNVDDVNPMPATDATDAQPCSTTVSPCLNFTSASVPDSSTETLRPSLSKEIPSDQDPLKFPFKTGTGRTPLILASLRGDVGVARLLVERGANVAYVDRNGLTAVDYAAYFGNVELVRYLAERQVEAMEGDGMATLRARQCAAIGSAKARTNDERNDFTNINSILTAAVSAQSRVSVR